MVWYIYVMVSHPLEYSGGLGGYIDWEPWNFIANGPEELVLIAATEW